jgi:hypothetical protein
MSIDADEHQFVVEELDENTVVVKESQLQELKRRLEEVKFMRGQLLLTPC